MIDLLIDKDIPAPSKDDTWQGKLNRLEVGESFPFPTEKRNSVRQNISGYFHKETEKRFTVSTKNQPRGLARVWRVENADLEEEAIN